jgi:His/Glu/Gln/Arg/opine family amino acid ABC transporter permease subunit
MPMLMAGHLEHARFWRWRRWFARGIGGVLVCLVRLYARRCRSAVLAIAFIDVFRAIPILVLLVLIYYALPFMGVRSQPLRSRPRWR